MTQFVPWKASVTPGHTLHRNSFAIIASVPLTWHHSIKSTRDRESPRSRRRTEERTFSSRGGRDRMVHGGLGCTSAHLRGVSILRSRQRTQRTGGQPLRGRGQQDVRTALSPCSTRVHMEREHGHPTVTSRAVK